MTETKDPQSRPQTTSKISLKELTTPTLPQEPFRPIQLMLLSDHDEVKKLNYYLFRGVEGVEYYTVEELDPADLSILKEMDILVYNRSDEALKSAILAYIAKEHLPLKFYYISDKSYIRQKDLLLEHMKGVDKVLKLDFLLEDYILSMEKNLRTRFYSTRVLALEEDKKVLYDEHARFERKIETLLQNQIFFSLLRYHYDADIDITSYNLNKIVREFDTIMIDRERHTITFCLLNVLPRFAATIVESRIANFSITLHPIEVKSAFELLFERENG